MTKQMNRRAARISALLCGAAALASVLTAVAAGPAADRANAAAAQEVPVIVIRSPAQPPARGGSRRAAGHRITRVAGCRLSHE